MKAAVPMCSIPAPVRCWPRWPTPRRQTSTTSATPLPFPAILLSWGPTRMIQGPPMPGRPTSSTPPRATSYARCSTRRRHRATILALPWPSPVPLWSWGHRTIRPGRHTSLTPPPATSRVRWPTPRIQAARISAPPWPSPAPPWSWGHRMPVSGQCTSSAPPRAASRTPWPTPRRHKARISALRGHLR